VTGRLVKLLEHPARQKTCDTFGNVLTKPYVHSRLDIDCGSTTTRAVLSWLDEDGKLKWLVVQNKDKVALLWLEDGQFPTLVYPFDTVDSNDTPLYDCTRIHHNRDAASGKYWFYYMAGFPQDKLLAEYTHVHALRRHAGSPEFGRRFRRGLVELFVSVLNAAKALCDRKLLRITELGLSIPAQWTLEFQDVYTDIITEAYKEAHSGASIQAEDIHYIYETEAIAHYLLSKHLEELRMPTVRANARRAVKKDARLLYEKILFLDFGGHSMVRLPFHLAQPVLPNGRLHN
jgi:hypothetical protein